MNTFHKNPKKSSTTKINKHKVSGYSLFANCSFHTTKNKLHCYRGKDCMKNFFIDLRKHVTKIYNYEKRNDTINKLKKKLYHKQKVWHVCKERFSTDFGKLFSICFNCCIEVSKHFRNNIKN